MMRRLALLIAAALACAAPPPRADGWRILGPGGGASWRIVNLGDTVQFFLFDPIDPRVIYAKALGVFRSADGGDTWTRFFPRDVRKITMGDDHASGRIVASDRKSTRLNSS